MNCKIKDDIKFKKKTKKKFQQIKSTKISKKLKWWIKNLKIKNDSNDSN
jgi:hypothetical protein